jgi:hypothetical protein
MSGSGGGERKAALDLEKVEREIEKLKAEVPKLHSDNRFLNRHAGAAVALAAAFISGLNVWNTITIQREQSERARVDGARAEAARAATAREQEARAQQERNRLEAERTIRCVEIGMKVGEFTRLLLRDSPVHDIESVERLANTMIGLFPPTEAAAVLRTVRVNLPATLVGQPRFRQRWEEMLDSLETGTTSGCVRALDVRFNASPDTQVAMLPPPTPPAPPPPRPNSGRTNFPGTAPDTAPAAGTAAGSAIGIGPACPALPAPPADAERLLVFTQVVQGVDRDPARSVLVRAATLDSAFNRAPIEDIRARNPDAQRAEVRYYHHRHADEAAHLVALIRRAACLEGLGTPLGGLGAVYIGDRFQNLPDGRIELWMPRLTPG